MAGYAVIELGDSQCVWGVHRLKSKAIKDALRWLPTFPDYKIKDMSDLKQALRSGELLAVPCSRKLIREVEEYGGEIDFNYFPGCGVFLPEEAR